VKKTKGPDCNFEVHYKSILGGISHVIDAARKSAARSVNCIMTAAYWLIGRRIVESEQKGEIRAEYGDELIERLAADLSVRHGGGFSVRNVWQMKAFYLAWPIVRTLSAQSPLFRIASSFSLPWSAYVRLMSVKNEIARRVVGAAARPADQFPVLRTHRHAW
jgi:hypothetical protein